MNSSKEQAFTSNPLTKGELKELAGVKEENCISVYLPTFKSGRETMKGHIYLKNLLNEVDSELAERGLRWDAIEALTKPAHMLAEDSYFWQHQGDGLALFIADGVSRTYKLPIAVPSMQCVDDSFLITPLLPLLEKDGHFYILALSENEVKLYDASRYEIEEVWVDSLPKGMAEALGAEDKETRVQWHTAGTSAGGAGGQATYSGAGEETGMEQRKVDIKRYFDKVVAALATRFKDQPAPVVLAGVAYLLPIYRAANSSAKILDGEVHGNMEHEFAADIQKAAWAIAEPHFASHEENAKDFFYQAQASGTASGDLKEILEAVEGGRVATLFVSLGGHEGGAGIDAKTLNLAARETLLKSGEVYALAQEAMPSGLRVAATFRY